MDSKDEALYKIAVDALRAIQRHTTKVRHEKLWKHAITSVFDAKRQIETDEEIAAIRAPVRHYPPSTH